MERSLPTVRASLLVVARRHRAGSFVLTTLLVFFLALSLIGALAGVPRSRLSGTALVAESLGALASAQDVSFSARAGTSTLIYHHYGGTYDLLFGRHGEILVLHRAVYMRGVGGIGRAWYRFPRGVGRGGASGRVLLGELGLTNVTCRRGDAGTYNGVAAWPVTCGDIAVEIGTGGPVAPLGLTLTAATSATTSTTTGSTTAPARMVITFSYKKGYLHAPRVERAPARLAGVLRSIATTSSAYANVGFVLGNAPLFLRLP
jgi:hypothetical protein